MSCDRACVIINPDRCATRKSFQLGFVRPLYSFMFIPFRQRSPFCLSVSIKKKKKKKPSPSVSLMRRLCVRWRLVKLLLLGSWEPSHGQWHGNGSALISALNTHTHVDSICFNVLSCDSWSKAGPLQCPWVWGSNHQLSDNAARGPPLSVFKSKIKKKKSRGLIFHN